MYAESLTTVAAELILFWLKNYIESWHIQTFWIVAPADVVFTTSVGFDIFNNEVCTVFCFFAKCAYCEEGSTT
jgi:hypothetical protein